MENKFEISDELLAKYISGTASESETAQVLAYFSQNDELANDFVNICAAIELQKNIDKQLKIKKSTQKRSRKPLWFAISAIAAAVAIVVVCLFTLPQSQESSQIAQSIDTKPLAQTVSQTDTAAVSEKIEPDGVLPEKEATPENVSKSDEQGLIPQMNHAQNYAATESRSNFCTMIVPRKEKHTVVCSDLDKSFDFRWSSDAKNATLILKDKTGKTILKKNLHGNKTFGIKLLDYYKYETIVWSLDLEYENGSEEHKTGTLFFEISDDGTWYIDRSGDSSM